jgi:hypothetical protein
LEVIKKDQLRNMLHSEKQEGLTNRNMKKPTSYFLFQLGELKTHLLLRKTEGKNE